MPVVTLYFNRLQKILKRKTSREKILSTLPFLGVDIEEQTEDHVNIEYSPNRPDFSTDYGIITGLKGLLGIELGMPKLKIKKGKDIVKADPSVAKVRPYVTAIEARNGRLDDETIRQIIAMQEDLHNGIGRRRKKISIGIHDHDKIQFPAIYKTVEKSYKFIPLNSTEELSISEILEKTETGIGYKHLIYGHEKVPIIIDSMGNTISFPPIINSKFTEVTNKTKNLFIEVTATDKNAAEDTLAVVAYALQNAGFELFSVRISGPRNSTPSLTTREMLLDPSLVNKTLGLDMKLPLIIKSLRRSRLDAKTKGRKILCKIPRYRTDIFGPIDLIEEIALGYGIQNLEPTIPQSVSTGQKNRVTVLLDAISSVMIGLGYSEVMNFSLVGKQIQYDLANRNPHNMISVTDSKSQEHSTLRYAILPSLMDILSRNIHEQYPQKIFEIGTTFRRDHPVIEEISLGCVSAHNDASFTEIKSVLQSLLKTAFNLDCNTVRGEDPMFIQGRTASIFVNERKIGLIGEFASQIIDNFKLRIPMAGFEIKLTGLIFD